MTEEKVEFDFKSVLHLFDEQTAQIIDRETISQEMREKFQELISKYKDLNKLKQEKEKLLSQRRKEQRHAFRSQQAYFGEISAVGSVVNNEERKNSVVQKNTTDKKLEVIEKIKQARKNLNDLYSQYEGDKFANVMHNLETEIDSSQSRNSKTNALIQSAAQPDEKCWKFKTVDALSDFSTDIAVQQLENEMNKKKAELLKPIVKNLTRPKDN